MGVCAAATQTRPYVTARAALLPPRAARLPTRAAGGRRLVPGVRPTRKVGLAGCRRRGFAGLVRRPDVRATDITTYRSVLTFRLTTPLSMTAALMPANSTSISMVSGLTVRLPPCCSRRGTGRRCQPGRNARIPCWFRRRTPCDSQCRCSACYGAGFLAHSTKFRARRWLRARHRRAGL